MKFLEVFSSAKLTVFFCFLYLSSRNKYQLDNLDFNSMNLKKLVPIRKQFLFAYLTKKSRKKGDIVSILKPSYNFNINKQVNIVKKL